MAKKSWRDCIVSLEEYRENPDSHADLIKEYRDERKFIVPKAEQIRIRKETYRESQARLTANSPFKVWKDTPSHKQCRMCRQILPREVYRKTSKSADGVSTRCPECEREANKRYRLKAKTKLPAAGNTINNEDSKKKLKPLNQKENEDNRNCRYQRPHNPSK